MPLRNKVAVITGSANGIGAAIAEVFADNGASLLLLDRDSKGNARTAAHLGSRTRIVDFALDLRDRPAIDIACGRLQAHITAGCHLAFVGVPY